MRQPWKILLLLVLLGLGATAPALAGVPRVIFADDFGYAT
jgi:hypothetical protein